MPDYISNIRNSGLSIYDEIDPENRALFIPLYALERILHSPCKSPLAFSSVHQ